MFQIQSVSKWARKVRVREFHFYSLRFRQHTTMKGAGRPSVWLWNKKYSGNNSQHRWQEKEKNLLILARTYTVHTVIRCQKEQMDRWHEHYGGKRASGCLVTRKPDALKAAVMQSNVFSESRCWQRCRVTFSAILTWTVQQGWVTLAEASDAQGLCTAGYL